MLNVTIQFFSQSVAVGMRIYKSEHPALKDCDGTITFIERVNRVIDVMNSRTPLTAMRKESTQRMVRIYLLVSIVMHIS